MIYRYLHLLYLPLEYIFLFCISSFNSKGPSLSEIQVKALFAIGCQGGDFPGSFNEMFCREENEQNKTFIILGKFNSIIWNNVQAWVYNVCIESYIRDAWPLRMESF